MNVVFKDIVVPKLTIAPDRSEVKIPTGHPEAQRYIDFAQLVVDEAGPVENTVRGHFSQHDTGYLWITLHYGRSGKKYTGQKKFKTFTEK